MKLAPLHWSQLKHMGQSAAHFRYHLDNPVKETDAMRLGSRVDELVFRGGRDRFAIWEGGRRAGNEWDAFEAAHSDAIIITAAQEEKAIAISDAVRANSDALEAIFACSVQELRAWKVGDRDCEGTPDAIGAVSIVDLKTTNDTSPARFSWQAQKMGWLGQLAWYDYGVFRGQAERLTLIAAPSQPPYVPELVTVYNLSPDACELGHRTWRSHFERLMVCEASDVWPGHSQIPVELQIDRDFTLHFGGEEVEVD